MNSNRELVIEKIRQHSRTIANKIEYSLSGHQHSIVRKNAPLYKLPSMHTYALMRKSGDNTIKMFETMLKYKIGDCSEQSAMLAFTLKNIEIVDKNYQIYFVSTMRDNPVKHTFLILVPNHLQVFFKGKKFLNGTGKFILLNKDQFICCDPWRNFDPRTEISEKSHPLDFIPGLDFGKCNFEFCNISLGFKKTLADFKKFIQLQKEYKYLNYKNIISLSMTCTFFKNKTRDARELLKNNNIRENVIASFDKSF